jgi:hypothetical protein
MTSFTWPLLRDYQDPMSCGKGSRLVSILLPQCGQRELGRLPIGPARRHGRRLTIVLREVRCSVILRRTGSSSSSGNMAVTEL